MATVYKAKCHVLNRYVAVKVLRDEFTTDTEFIKRFEAEAQSAASLTHPNIVSIYDVGNEGDLYYIVMELIQGKTLKEIINEEGALPWKWSVNIAMQIASALETAHKNNIVHRDIKPHNIIITEDGIAKVTDFGIAKAVSNSTITAFGTTIGSVHYFSPEHARGGYTDAKSDLYSLGVVMYEMVTGKVPFDADTPVSIALKHMQEKPVEPIKVNPAVPFAVNKIIMKAMQKDTNLRYSSATEMMRDLSLALKNPDGDFVLTKDRQGDMPTQKIPTVMDRSMEDRIKEKDEEMQKSSKKKKSKIGQYFERHKIQRVFLILLICCVIFFAALFITLGILKANTPKEVQIPNLANMTEEQAREEAGKLKVEIEVAGEEYNKDVEAGKIISQDPEYKENYNIKEKSVIKVTISKGTKMTTVPKVVGMTKEDAIQELKNRELEAEVIEETSAKVEENYIIKQETPEDTEIEAGSTVKIYVSIGRGIEEVTVPTLIGKTEEEAKTEIANNKLTYTTTNYKEDTTKDDGVVLEQSIEPGKTVDEGTGITITVNKRTKSKEVKISINVNKITGGYKEPTNTNTVNTDIEKNANVQLLVDGKAVYTQSGVDKNSKTLLTTSVSIKENETKELALRITDSKNGDWTRTTTISYNNDEYTFE